MDSEGQMTKSLFDLCLRYLARNAILAETAHLWTPEGDLRWEDLCYYGGK